VRVFLAGATGVIGRPLIEQLLTAGHEVTAMTRTQGKTAALRDAGVEPAVADALDPDQLRAAVVASGSDVVINQLTQLPERLNYRKAETFAMTNRLRAEAGPNLAKAAAEAGAKRLISQSVCFFYAAAGSAVKTEEDPLFTPPPGSTFADGIDSLQALESSTLETDGVEGVVLRYGYFYGPGTYYASDGTMAADVRKRRFPVVGGGTGVFSLIHADDAASATVAALERGQGIYNVCDDHPAPLSEWLPVYAEAIGAKPPRRVPVWIARMIAGKEVATMATQLRGASNEKAKRELGWQPKYPSWRQGFAEALG
jgi:nucleoside-diphosphate-sugar epimerase